MIVYNTGAVGPNSSARRARGSTPLDTPARRSARLQDKQKNDKPVENIQVETFKPPLSLKQIASSDMRTSTSSEDSTTDTDRESYGYGKRRAHPPVDSQAVRRSARLRNKDKAEKPKELVEEKEEEQLRMKEELERAKTEQLMQELKRKQEAEEERRRKKKEQEEDGKEDIHNQLTLMQRDVAKKKLRGLL